MPEEIKEVEDPRNLPMTIIDGRPYPIFVRGDKFDEFKEKAKFQDGDVIVMCYPKSGTHWADGYLGMLLSNSQEIIQVGKGSLEGLLSVDMINSQAHPRIFYTHLSYSHLPRDILENEKIKLLLLIRNPKDTALSYYHYMKTWVCNNTKFTGPFSSFIGPWIDGRLCFGSWFDYYRDMYQNLVGRENVVVIQFEKMKLDFLSNLRKIADFLGIEANEELFRHIARKTTFPQMSNWATSLAVSGRGPSTVYFRKGIVGDWRSEMTEQAARRIDERLGELKSSLEGYEDFEG